MDQAKARMAEMKAEFESKMNTRLISKQKDLNLVQSQLEELRNKYKDDEVVSDESNQMLLRLEDHWRNWKGLYPI